ncbi:MAG: glycosyltransferase family 4 protein [Phycisphaerae bacterium]|nr:glycosyltransferase family 4 protein [Phycisphaerae bacterium]
MSPGGTQSKNLRVAWITDFQTAVGLSSLLDPLVGPFSRQNVQFSLLCPQEVKDFKNVRPLLQDQDMLDSLFTSHKSSHNISRAVDEISGANIDILHSLDDKSSLVAAEISQRTGIPYIASCMSLGSGRKAWSSDPQLIAALPSSTIIREDLLERHVVPPSKIVLLRAGLIPADEPKSLADCNGMIAIFADGTKCDRPGLREALIGFDELRKIENDCTFFLVCPEKHEKNLRRLADELDLQHDLTFIIAKTDSNPAKIIPSTNVFISLGVREQLDVNPLMAMAAGVPVIAAKGAPCDFLIDETTAMLFDPVKPAQLTGKLIETVTDKSETDARSARALQYVRENHDQLKCLRGFVNFYRQAASEM